MMRILFWIAFFILVGFAIRSKLRGLIPKDGAIPPEGKALPEGEPMTSCAHCHMYFPASEAVRADGLDYCSAAHVRLPAE